MKPRYLYPGPQNALAEASESASAALWRTAMAAGVRIGSVLLLAFLSLNGCRSAIDDDRTRL